MLGKIITAISLWVIHVISALGYGGIVLLMAIESACIPLPSEIIMPFSGYLVSQGQMSLAWVALAGAVGCVVGSIPAYYLGKYGGRPMIERFGRYILISHHDLDMADRAFARHGEIIIFFGRLLPVVRTFIAFPAGVAEMAMGRFVIYTFVGSLIWCWALAYVGKELGDNWHSLEPYFHEFDSLIAVVFGALLGWYVWRHIKNSRKA